MKNILANAVRYVSLNPVPAGLVEKAEEWSWSSVAAHLSKKDDGLVKVAPILERYGDFRKFLDEEGDVAGEYKRLRQSETTGRPLGNDEWLEKLEAITGKQLKPLKRGPKKARDK